MKRKLVRICLVLLCLFLAGYYFLRGPSPEWTCETKNANVLGFTPDGQSFWAFGCDESNERNTITFQRYELATGKVLTEYQVILDISDQDQIIELSGDNKMAYIKVPRARGKAKYNTQDLLIDLTNGAVRKIPDSGPDSGPGRYSLSPTGKWFYRNDRGRVVIDQQSMQIVCTLEDEVDADGKNCMPCYVSFSPDEKRMAVAWNHLDGKGSASSSEIRFYDTGSWKEQSRVTISQAGYCNLDGWYENQLWYTIADKGNVSLNELIFGFYCLDTAVPPSSIGSSNANLISPGYARSYANVMENRLMLHRGLNWHVVKEYRQAYQNKWIKFLRDKPIISGIIEKNWPHEVIALVFYQTSTQQKLNRLLIKPRSKYCISHDGQWIAGLLNYKDQLDLYSTAPLMRWPGYLFVLAGVIILFWRRTKQTQVSG